MDAEAANKIFDLLVREAGAVERDRKAFVLEMCSSHTEFRFCGLLGFGGKFWNDRGWYVTCYEEDEEPERKAIIKRVNEQLAEMKGKCP